jgi:four helix bundle protein
MNRSALSIASNIAEGASRASRREQAHFTEIAYGSLMELLCQIIIAHELSYISHDLLNESRRKAEEIAKMLSAMRRFQTKD